MPPYSLHVLHDGLKRRFADIIMYFNPWEKRMFISNGLKSELAFFSTAFGHVRLVTGEMPPYSKFLVYMQNALNNLEDLRLWEGMSLEAILVMTGSEGAEPQDNTGFPRWWLDAPQLLPFGFSRPAFNLSAWIMAQSVEAMRAILDSEGADINAFAAQYRSVLACLQRVRISADQRARIIEGLHNDGANALLLFNNTSPDAAHFAETEQ